ncbi:MAG: serine hydrolase, partial [Planctomycetota bacterium]|nr:serine hydrolase [Planctomycetota bacterium]
NSSVVDMAQWLRLQLGKGEVDGTQLISTDSLLETWEPQIEIGGGVSYGLGWMLHEIDGRAVVEHGGNIGGFSAQVGLMPEENMGYVLLTNLSVAPLQQSSLSVVFGALLEEWPEANDETQTDAGPIQFEDYTGTYLANFANFEDAEFKVLMLEDQLAVDIPGQQVFELKQPDGEGKWFFALTDQVALSFQRNDRDAVVGLSVHQGGFQFELPRKGVEVEVVEAPPEFEKYVGTYVRQIGGKHIKILIQRGRLAMEDKGKLLEFNTPDANEHASLRARADFGATFESDSDGKIVSLIFHGNSGDRLFTRLAEEPDPDLPTLEEIHTLRKTEQRIAARSSAGGTKFTGDIWVAQAGLRGTVTIYSQGTDCFANHMDFGRFGRVDAAIRGGHGWSYNAMTGFDVLTGDQLAQAILDHPGAVEGDWSEYFDSIEVLRNDTLNDRPVHIMSLKKGDLPKRTYWIDAENGDVLRVEFIAMEGPVRMPAAIAYSAFELIDGIRTPHRVEMENPASGKIVLTMKSHESGLDLATEVFTLVDLDDED